VSLRVLVCALFAVLASAAPAQAQLETPPTEIRFEDGRTASGAGQVLTTECDRIVASGGWNGGTYLVLGCPSSRFLSFSEPQSMVEFFVRVPVDQTATFQACDPQQCSGVTQTVSGDGGWKPVILDAGGATIWSVARPSLSSGGPLELDDVAFSPVRQPGTAISGSTQFAAGVPVTFELFSSGVAPVAFACSLDGAAFAPCSSPYTATGLAGGGHTLAVTSVDAYGAGDPTPAQVTFNVAESDSDRDGRPDASDNCPSVANSDQADGDADGVGNACEQLPAGNVPPVAGVNAIIRQVSGEVFVKLPAANSRLGFRGMIAAFQESGFVSLKGVASVPIGSTVDTRKGEIALQSAANGFAGGDRRARRQSARIRAGLFLIKQDRAKRRATTRQRRKSISLDVDLLSPPRAEAICQRGPSKGIVRTMSMVVKGNYRALGGASTATARNATFNTTDRCDGTLTEVGKGRVSLKVRGKRKPVVVRGGSAYLSKAKLFQVRKGRRPAKGGD
jgi:hypothetical protein